MKKVLILFLFYLAVPASLNAHTGRPAYHIIIDTDGALDDMRAITMLLAASEIRVLAISTSTGTLDPVDAYIKVNSLLSYFHHEGIPTGINHSNTGNLPYWSKFAEEIYWGDSVEMKNPPDAISMLNELTVDYPDKLTLIAMGSLSTYATWISEHKNIANQIERIIWYNELPVDSGFNYSLDPESFHIIESSGIPLQIVTNDVNELAFDDNYFRSQENCTSVYAAKIAGTAEQLRSMKQSEMEHLMLADDLLPLYMTAPMLFHETKSGKTSLASPDKSIPVEFMFDIIARLLESGNENNNRVFENFPVDKNLYKPAVAAILDSAIHKFGNTEWKAICLTNEIHGHTGIYSIIGAKMGIRACEYFNIGVNNLTVTSFAGNSPPLSCLNDGIQISTGATIGQGLITISDTISKIPSALFEFNGQIIRISLDPWIATRIRKDIGEAVKAYGFSEKYWLNVERLAIEYWCEMDRHQIFIIEKL